MCGLAGVLTNGVLSADERMIFTQLLLMGVVRGEDSTGIMAINPKKGASIFRDAQPSYKTLSTQRYKDWMDEGRQKQAAALLVHHRAATSGTIYECHPFTHGKISLMMNGTVRQQHLLPEYDQFKTKVDSDHVSYLVNHLGIEETLRKLDSPYALVWADMSDGSVNIIRNSERPLYMMKQGIMWAYASEKEMISWLLTRGSKYTTRAIDEQYELEPGMQYKFQWNKHRQLSLTKIKRELYTPKVINTYGGSRGRGWMGFGYDDEQDDITLVKTPPITTETPPKLPRPTAQPSSVVAKLRETNARNVLIKHNLGVTLNDEVTFCTFQFVPYGGSDSMGHLLGMAEDTEGGYAEVVVFGVSKDLADRIIKHEISLVGTICWAKEERYTEVGKAPVEVPVLTLTNVDYSGVPN